MDKERRIPNKKGHNAANGPVRVWNMNPHLASKLESDRHESMASLGRRATKMVNAI